MSEYEPFVAIGNDELDTLPSLQAGTPVVCRECGNLHPAEVWPSESGDITLETIRCGERSYLIGIQGRRIR